MSDIKTRHIIALLLENESGALSRVSGLFSARGYNIESLTVAPTDDSTLSRMTIVTYGTEDIVEQITKQPRLQELVCHCQYQIFRTETIFRISDCLQILHLQLLKLFYIFQKKPDLGLLAYLTILLKFKYLSYINNKNK